jgi:hypothetical protein
MSSFVDKKWRKGNEMFSYWNGFVCMLDYWSKSSPKSCMDPEAKTKGSSLQSLVVDSVMSLTTPK